MVDLHPNDRPVAKLALTLGYKQHTIANFLGGFNQGRISEFKRSPVFHTVVPARALPAGFPPL